MSSCPDSGLLVAYRDGDGPFGADFRQHVEACATCRLALRVLDEAQPAFVAPPLPEDVAEGLVDAVFARVAPVPHAPRIGFWDVGVPGLLAAAIGFAAAVATGALGPGTTLGHLLTLLTAYGTAGVWLDYRMALRDAVSAREAVAGA